MGRAITPTETALNDRLWVSLDFAKLKQLMVAGHLNGMDLHTADPAIKEVIRELCLQSCAQKTCQACPHQAQCVVHQAAHQQVISVAFKARRLF